MSIEIIQQRLIEYRCETHQDEERALREIMQEIILAGLTRQDFFKHAVFQGGTCLRILYGLDRFSEDLDFVLHTPQTDFSWAPYLRQILQECTAYGIQLTVQDRSEVSDTVKKAFLKDQSIGQILTLRHRLTTGRPRHLRIKLEIDTNPPPLSRCETKYLDFPFAAALTVHDLPSLFAGKNHALLCRAYTKGRDWYDFAWYVARKTPINWPFFEQGLRQQGPWAHADFQCTPAWYVETLTNKIRTMDWKAAQGEMQRFLKVSALPHLEVWGVDFFLDRLRKLQGYAFNT